jgi:hypothetical protein
MFSLICIDTGEVLMNMDELDIPTQYFHHDNQEYSILDIDQDRKIVRCAVNLVECG